MKYLIKKLLREEVIFLHEFKINRKKLMNDLKIMDYSFEDAEKELEYHIEWIKSLPNELKLYRIVYVDDESEINMRQPGKHYSTDIENLIGYHEYISGYGDKKFLLTVIADKSLINVQETISNNILYPNEKEITLKHNGRGVKIIKVVELF